MGYSHALQDPKENLGTKLPFALFGQTNQPFTLLSKLNKKMQIGRAHV